ncbi:MULTISPECIES: ABC transporter permease [unclassified Frigoribacterium]|uniref:ABC transporter permease n=1 Tax=unclassified Frigoribacterium TaxID=2627005 RepID=UPI0006F8DAA8|nr:MULTISPECIES: ABC transporter permease [unclassified Frigoribacterium]KQO47543.1 ABC transporter permease [Frigoribacterium sp. Leaf254]KQT39636.1 ABC transporter permease [Frigoribacterium sp. Leaf415]
MSPADPRDTRPDAVVPADRTRGGLGLALLGSELAVLFRRVRTIALLAALALIPVLLAVAVRVTSSDGDGGRGPAFLGDITQNGLFVSLTALTVAIPLFLPLTVGVVAGDTIAGEASLGTLRYLLVTPVGRVRLLLVKYAAAAAFCLAATLVVVVFGAIAGAALFPVGPVTLLSGQTIGLGDYALRLLLMALYVTMSLLGLTAIGVFASTLTSVPVGAMAATIVLSTVAQIVDALPQLDVLDPWLFTHHWLGFADLMRDPVSWDSFGANALLQAGYVVVFGALALGRFTTKDVLS